jgi:hypothetical protein
MEIFIPKKCIKILNSGKNKGNICNRDTVNKTEYCKIHNN